MNPRRTSRVSILLSSIVWPGAGQFFQRRWLAGALYGCVFTAGLSWFIVMWVKLMIHYYKMGFEFETYEPDGISVLSLVRPFFIALAIYVLNILDVAVAQQRMRSNAAEEAMLTKFDAESADTKSRDM